MKIPFGELKIGPVARQHIEDCLQRNWVTMGEKVAEFENRFKNEFDYKHCTMVNSGTSADTVACMSLYELGARPGDEVIVPALSFIATANSVRMAGLTPVFVDVDRRTLNIDVTKIEAAITPRTRAVMSVNLMGRPADLHHIKNICDDRQLIHIVDNCEAYGSELYDKYSLSYADMETTSHYTAHIVQSVEGGCIFTNNPQLADLHVAIRTHGRVKGSKHFDHKYFGGNFKPTDLHACVGLEQLAEFWENFQARKWVWHCIRNIVHDTGLIDYCFISEEDPNRINAPHGFSFTFHKVGHADIFKQIFEDAGIEVKRNFGCMATQHDCSRHLGYYHGHFPEAEHVGRCGYHIGTHRYMGLEEIKYIRRQAEKVVDLLPKRKKS